MIKKPMSEREAQEVARVLLQKAGGDADIASDWVVRFYLPQHQRVLAEALERVSPCPSRV